jgi:hypoxanthine phosphoribosyltransferase
MGRNQVEVTSEVNMDNQSDVIGTAPYRFRRMISSNVIQKYVQDISSRLREEYKDKNPILIGVLNGCFIFMADLVRYMNIPCAMDFIKISSYRNGLTSGDIEIRKDINANLTGRHVIVVEDIVDTGKSIEFMRELVMKHNPASLVIVTMFLKPRSMRTNSKIEYVGLELPDDFVVGYGLDYAQQWRQLPDLYVLAEEDRVS